ALGLPLPSALPPRRRRPLHAGGAALARDHARPLGGLPLRRKERARMRDTRALRPPLVFCVLDGFGLAPPSPTNAISQARTPHWDRFWSEAPHARLSASGEDVGLPAGQVGHSEGGHLNLGAGRIVSQDNLRITRSIRDGSFYENEALVEACEHVRRTGGALHFLGLVSDGGVHSHLSHLDGLLELARRQRLSRVFLHAFLDGRDTPPRSALRYV